MIQTWEYVHVFLKLWGSDPNLSARHVYISLFTYTLQYSLQATVPAFLLWCVTEGHLCNIQHFVIFSKCFRLWNASVLGLLDLGFYLHCFCVLGSGSASSREPRLMLAPITAATLQGLQPTCSSARLSLWIVQVRRTILEAISNNPCKCGLFPWPRVALSRSCWGSIIQRVFLDQH